MANKKKEKTELAVGAFDLGKNSGENPNMVSRPEPPAPIPREDIVGISKQINAVNKRINPKDSKVNKIQSLLQDVRTGSSKLEQDLISLSPSLYKKIDTEDLSLTNVAVLRPNSDSSIFKLAGKTSKQQSYTDVISSTLEERMGNIVSGIPTGLYTKILQAKYNNYLEENLPVLKQSATIFIDDVCNGTYRGAEQENVKRFRFWKEGGVEITDEKLVTRMNNILNPKSYERISSDVSSFNDIDYQTEYTSWKDGYSLVRVVSNRKIAKEMYIKYVLKQVKAKKENKTDTNNPVRTIEPGDGRYDLAQVNKIINIENHTGLPLNIKNKPLARLIDSRVLDRITKSGCVYSMEKFNPKAYTSEFELNEYTYSNESFADFVRRNAENRARPVYNTTDKISNNTIFPGAYFTFEIGGYSTGTMNVVAEKIAKMNKEVEMLGTESVDSFMYLDTDTINFDDIYSNRFDKFKEYSMEASGIDTVHQGPQPSNLNKETGVYKSVEKKIAKDNISLGRIEKMFDTITGESIEYLDNTRCIPLIVGNKFLGTFYIEFTHQDVEHYMGLRQLMNSNMVGTSDTTAFGINVETQEETIGRLIFSDIIKPLVEANMDTKFIKNNADVLLTIQKLLKENEVSTTMNLNSMDRQNGFNLSRVIFIPAEELIFKRNGKLGLGESRFNMALVPANAAILGNEAYLSYLLIDSKGMSFIELPQGLSEIQGEEGTNPIMDQFNDIRITRSRLRDLTLNNYDLGHKIIYVQKPESTQGININTISIPQPELDDARIQQWIQQATDIVGYNSALFNSVDGSVEFARNLFEMNEMKLLQIITCRANKIRPSSELATRLLRLRDPSYSDITVEWVAPPINKSNTQKRSEQAKEIMDLFDTYGNVMDNLYGNNDEYNLVVEEAKKILLDKVAGDDQIIQDILFNVVKEAKQKKNVAIAMELEEEDEDEEKKKKKDDNEEEEENNEEENEE